MTMRRTFLSAIGLAALASIAATGAASAQVVVYNTVGTKLMQAFVEGFEKVSPGIKVDVISGGSGELLTRIKAERSRPAGDVFVGPDADVFDAELDLFDSYKSTEDASFDPKILHKDRKYYPFSMNFQAFIVNTKMMPLAGAPKSWMDLTKPEYKGKIVMANPAQSGSAYSQMQQLIDLHGWDMIGKLVQNATFVTSSRLVFQNVAKGEVAVGLTSEFNVLAMKQDGQPVDGVYPADGTALIVDASGIIKGGPNTANARKFLDFLNSKASHEILVAVDKRRSARSDVAPPPGLPAVASLKTIGYDSVAAAKNRTANLERFDKLLAAK